ncbi:MAG: UDP-N-acetylglucosamine diphosphorylase [Verrucomicrobiota bacterium]
MSAPEFSDFFDASRFSHIELFRKGDAVWLAVPRIAEYLQTLQLDENHADITGSPVIEGAVHIGPGSRIDPGAYIQGPAWIGENVHIRHGAYIRGNVIVGNGSVLGNSCEFKNSILMNNVQVPHFSYVGDSILGNNTHLGAGVICSNLRTDQAEICVDWDGNKFDTGLRKLGVITGDDVEVGCQSVLNPGSLLGKSSWLHPGVVWAGSCPPHSRVLNRNMVKWRSQER